MIKLFKALFGILIAAGIFTAIDVNNTVTDEVREKYGFVTVQEQTAEAETAGSDSNDDNIVAIIRNKNPKKAEETTEPSSETFRSGQTNKSGIQVTEEDDMVRETETSAAVPAETVSKIIERETERETTSPSLQRETEPVRNKVPETTAHVHRWDPITESVYHDQETKDVWVVDRASYDETVTYDEPVYDEHLVIIATCRGCGAQFTGAELDNVLINCGNHIMDAHNNACGYGLEDSYWEYTQTGTERKTETIHHDEEGHWETVVTKEAYCEAKVTGYMCLECGAEK